MRKWFRHRQGIEGEKERGRGQLHQKEEIQIGTKQVHCFRNTKNKSKNDNKMVTLKSSTTPSQLKVKLMENYQNSMKTYVPTTMQLL